MTAVCSSARNLEVAEKNQVALVYWVIIKLLQFYMKQNFLYVKKTFHIHIYSVKMKNRDSITTEPCLILATGFQIVALEKTLESPLNSKEIKPVSPIEN